jgi:FAD/FMN-containing dehydrogenase
LFKPVVTKMWSPRLRFAQKEGLRLTVPGGGHSATRYCLNTGGVVLEMSLMKGMLLDAKQRTLRVQMGALWSDVYS